MSVRHYRGKSPFSRLEFRVEVEKSLSPGLGTYWVHRRLTEVPLYLPAPIGWGVKSECRQNDQLADFAGAFQGQTWPITVSPVRMLLSLRQWLVVTLCVCSGGSQTGRQHPEGRVLSSEDCEGDVFLQLSFVKHMNWPQDVGRTKFLLTQSWVTGGGWGKG